MKNFCLDLTEYATKTIDYEKKEMMIPLIYKENELYKRQKVCYICKKWLSTDDDNKKYHKVRDYCHYTRIYRGVAHNQKNFL